MHLIHHRIQEIKKNLLKINQLHSRVLDQYQKIQMKLITTQMVAVVVVVVVSIVIINKLILIGHFLQIIQNRHILIVNQMMMIHLVQ